MRHAPAGMLGWESGVLPSGPHPHQEPANGGNPSGFNGDWGNVAAGFIWVHLGSRCVTLGTLGKARAPGLGSPWKLCKTFNFCRSQHPPEQSQEPGSPKEPRSWGKALDQSLQSQVWAGGYFWGPGAAGRKSKLGGETPSFKNSRSTK